MEQSLQGVLAFRNIFDFCVVPALRKMIKDTSKKDDFTKAMAVFFGCQPLVNALHDSGSEDLNILRSMATIAAMELRLCDSNNIPRERFGVEGVGDRTRDRLMKHVQEGLAGTPFWSNQPNIADRIVDMHAQLSDLFYPRFELKLRGLARCIQKNPHIVLEVNPPDFEVTRRVILEHFEIGNAAGGIARQSLQFALEKLYTLSRSRYRFKHHERVFQLPTDYIARRTYNYFRHTLLSLLEDYLAQAT